MSTLLAVSACLILTTPSLVFATLTIDDPSNVIPPALWASDNAIVGNYNVPFLSSQPSDILSKYSFTENKTTLSHESFYVDENDTSVILVSDGASLDLSYADVLKLGYFSDLLASSFWGFNAAINVANASTAHLKHVNITTHNGAANVYSYGTDTVVHISDSWLYSSGPVAHGLYASGNGTIIARNVQHFSGGIRSSSFAGDSPKGTVKVYDSIAHTAGIGSATYYALGTIHAENVLSLSENAPVIFMDSDQNATLINCDATAGLLGGVAIFSSSVRSSGAKLRLKDSKITTTGDTVPGLWFGNIIVDVTLDNSKLVTDSGVLVVANYSQMTQAFDTYASYEDNTSLQPAEVFVEVTESDLKGDLVAYNGSYISWKLDSYSSWVGSTVAGYGDAYFDISLDKTSSWNLTATAKVQNFTDHDHKLTNIQSGGFDIYYNSSALLNGWLKGKTKSLPGGGSILPY